MENNSLQHHGVKGMKWGVRRNRDDSGGGRPRVSRKVRRQRAANLKKARQAREANKELKIRKRNSYVLVKPKTYTEIGIYLQMKN